MPINQWPKQERPRERLLNVGAENLSDAELLAIMFGTGTQGKSALDLARDLLTHYRSLRDLFSADYQSFCKQPGLGLAKYTQLQASIELTRRFLQENIDRDGVLTQSYHVKNFLMAKLTHHQQEVFACLFLDSHFKTICFEKLFYGTINCATVHPREVVKRALYHNAAAVIIAHNHPSGATEPSQADHAITKQLEQALALVDIQLLDHFVIGGNQVMSFAEQGIL